MMNDKSNQGIQKLVIEDGNGGTDVGWVIPSQIKTARLVIVTLCTVGAFLLSVGVVAFQATRSGVAVQTEQQIRAESVEETGIIHQEIEHQLVEHEIESERRLNESLSSIQTSITEVQTIVKRIEGGH
jgi:hypothetical protein